MVLVDVDGLVDFGLGEAGEATPGGVQFTGSVFDGDVEEDAEKVQEVGSEEV